MTLNHVFVDNFPDDGSRHFPARQRPGHPEAGPQLGRNGEDDPGEVHSPSLVNQQYNSWSCIVAV